MRLRHEEQQRSIHHPRIDEAEAANMLISLGTSRSGSGTPRFSPTPLQGVSPHPGRPQSPMHLGYHGTGVCGHFRPVLRLQSWGLEILMRRALSDVMVVLKRVRH